MKIAAFLVILTAATSCNEQPYRTYTNVTAAVNAGEEQRGWLPPWFPRSGVNIHLQGDLDTNVWWLRGDLSKPAADSLKSKLIPANPDSISAHRPGGNAEWWFNRLVQQAPADDGALNAELYHGAGKPIPRTIVVAFDRVSSTVYAWSSAYE